MYREVFIGKFVDILRVLYYIILRYHYNLGSGI